MSRPTFPGHAVAIFDFDGLLVDTETAEFHAWDRLYREHGTQLEMEIWRHAVGYDGRVNPRTLLEERIGRTLDWEELNPKRRGYHMDIVEGLPPLPGVMDLFDWCADAGIRIAVASNSSQEWVSAGLQRVGLLERVEALATRDQVVHAKPHPDVYLLALEKLGASAECSIAFEDSEPGARAAKAAGLFVVAVPNEFTKLQDLSVADLSVSSLSELGMEELFAARMLRGGSQKL